MPMAATVAAAIAWNAGCGNSVSVLVGQFGVNNGAGVTRMADRIRTQAWLWEGDAPLRADGTAERCTHPHTHARLRIRARFRIRFRVRVRVRVGVRGRA